MSPVVIGNATLYLGDCREILPTLLRVDAVVTDPPYGEATHKGARTRIGKKGGADNVSSITFECVEQRQFLADLDALTALARRWVVMTCEWQFVAAVESSRDYFVRMGIWVKPNGAPQFTGDRPATGWEAVLVCHPASVVKRWNGGGRRAVWNVPTTSGHHPTEKPLRLIRDWVSDFTDVGETILDPYMGSGTTGVACMQMGRSFIGIEKEAKYFDIACKRIKAAQKQPDMFIEPKPAPRIEQGTLFAAA